MTFQVVTVTWNETDPALAAQAGSVTFQLTAPLIDSSGQIADLEQKTYLFTGGTGTSDPLAANDSAGATPTGTAYRITVSIPGQQPRSFTSQLLHANGASQTLGFLEANAAVPSVQYAQYLPLPSGTPVAGQVPVATGAGEATAWTTPAGGGTVTTVSVASANGFAGTVANPSTTPAITLQATPAGILKSNGTAVSAATAGTDYLAPNGSGAALTGITESQVANLTTDLAAKLAKASNLSDVASQQAALDNLAGAVTANQVLAGNGTHVTLRALAAADLPAGTTSAKGALQLDGTAADITADGTQSAGAAGLAADSGHVHPAVSWVPSDNGLLTAVCDPYAAGSSNIVTAGTMYLIKLNIRVAMTVTSLWWACNTAGAGASTGSFTGLYSSAGTLLSGSSDVGATFTSTGAKQLTLTTPQSLPAGTFVWAAILFNLATTQPTLIRAATSATVANAGLSASAFRAAINGTGITSLPGSITPSASTSGTPYWAGAS